MASVAGFGKRRSGGDVQKFEARTDHGLLLKKMIEKAASK